MSLAVSSERTHCSVGPRRAQMEATVVPQDPPPSTTTLGSRRLEVMGFSVLRIAGCSWGVRAIGWLSRHPHRARHPSERHVLVDLVDEVVVEGVGEIILPDHPRPLETRLG